MEGKAAGGRRFPKIPECVLSCLCLELIPVGSGEVMGRAGSAWNPLVEPKKMKSYSAMSWGWILEGSRMLCQELGGIHGGGSPGEAGFWEL